MNKKPTIHFFKSFLLFCIASILLITTAPFGFLYALLRQIVFQKVKTLNLFFIEVALVLDQAGNVVMQYLLNDLLLKKHPTTYFFGNKKETISSVIGKNCLTHTLTPLGMALNGFLNFIDNDHSLNSILYDVKVWMKN